MTCPKCMHVCRDGVTFCEICGNRLSIHTESPLLPPKERCRILRQGFSSPVALVMLIAYSGAVVCNLIAALRVPMYIREALRNLAGFIGAGDGRFEPFTSYYSVILLFTFLPGLLIAIGSWATYLSAVAGTGQMRSAAGLKAVAFGLVAEMTLRCVNFGWMGYLFLASGEDPGSNLNFSYLYGYSFTGSVLLRWTAIVSFLLMFLLLCAYIVYYRKAIRQVWYMRVTVEAGRPSGRISLYLVGFVFLMGALVIPDAFLLPDPLMAAVSVFNAVARIGAGMLLLIFRRNMQSLHVEKKAGSAAGDPPSAS